MKKNNKVMSKRVLVTIPDSLYEKLKKKGISHETDAELLRNALLLYIGD